MPTCCQRLLLLFVVAGMGAVVSDEEVPPPLVILSTTSEEAVTDAPEDDDEPSSNRSASEWFAEGVIAYLEENWGACVRRLENALVEWHHFHSAHIRCRLDCGEQAHRAPHLFPDDVEHLHFGEEMVRKTLCLIKCKKQSFSGRKTPEVMLPDQQDVFRSLKPYEYLQLCYFQKHDAQRAASAVFTFLSHNPENEVMKQNFRYYLSMPEVDVNKLQNFEAERYVQPYMIGTDAYYHEDYGSAIRHLEKSLQEYIAEEEECRADCEGPFNQGWFPDYTSSVANHFAYCLKCKSKCHLKLPNPSNDAAEDFLPTHYNYLQFAYYKQGKYKEACHAATSYLLFSPTDKTMLENVKYYKTLSQVEESMFKPRQEAVNYIQRHIYEAELLNYINEEFVFNTSMEQVKNPVHNEMNKAHWSTHYQVISHKQEQDNFNTPRSSTVVTSHEVHFDSGSSYDVKEIFENNKLEVKQRVKRPSKMSEITFLGLKQKAFKQDEEREFHKLESYIDKQTYNMRKEEQLSGLRRFSVDGLANKAECHQIVEFAKFAGVINDGYEGNKSPHSPSEKFEGVSLGRTALLVHFGLVDSTILELFLSLSERGRNITADYFKIPRQALYYSYTHLVCRSALQGRSSNSTDFSHQIHADNCLLQKDGKCIRGDPAYYWRDFSAILYLNDDFKGGEFIFAADPLGKSVQSSVKPTCGRLVGFSSGKENLHGVRSVQNGQRCALGLWFTLDPNQAEWGRTLTEQMVDQIKMLGNPNEHIVQELIKLVHFDILDSRKQMQEYQEETAASEEIK